MKGLMIFVFILLSGMHLFAQSKSATVLFDFDRYELKENEQTKLLNLLKSLADKKITGIELSGHTDEIGSTTYNRSLSQNRLNTVEQFLTNQGYTTFQKSEAKGEVVPVSTNKNAQGRALNRRVEVIVHFENAIVEGHKVEKDHISTLFALLKSPVQEFCINPKRDTVLIGKDKGIVAIKANTFFLSSEDMKQCVRITLRENFSYSSILLDNLITLSDDRILESDGMMEVMAYDQKGNPLALKKGKSITLLIPTKKKLEGIAFFDGVHNPIKNRINWVLNTTSNPQADRSANCPWLVEGGGCSKCKFFCRIGRFGEGLKGIVNDSVHKQNKTFRINNRTCRGRRSRSCTFWNVVFRPARCSGECKDLEKEFKKYGVNNYQDYQEALRVEQLKEIEKGLGDGSVHIDDLNYYMLTKSRMGYANCDRFSSIPEGQKTSMIFNLKKSDDTDIKVAFENEKIVLDAKDGGQKFQLDRVPRGRKVWVIVLKVAAGKYFMDMFQTIIGQPIKNIELKEVGVDEIKSAFSKFDK